MKLRRVCIWIAGSYSNIKLSNKDSSALCVRRAGLLSKKNAELRVLHNRLCGLNVLGFECDIDVWNYERVSRSCQMRPVG